MLKFIYEVANLFLLQLFTNGNDLIRKHGMKTGLTNIPYMRHLSINKGSGTGATILQNNSNLKLKQNNKKKNNTINTTAGNNTCGRVSFAGSVESTLIKQGKKSLAQKAAESERIRKIFLFINKHELLSESIIAGVFTCMLRPLTIISESQKEESKEKNKYAAVHSIASGLLGIAVAFMYNEPIKKAVSKAADMLEENKLIPLTDSELELTKFKEHEILELEQLLGTKIKEGQKKIKININEIINDENVIKNPTFERIIKKIKDEILILNKAADQTFLNKIANTISMPLKATFTIALIPILLGLFGIQKNNKKAKSQNNKNDDSAQSKILSTSFVARNASENKVFTNFARRYFSENK